MSGHATQNTTTPGLKRPLRSLDHQAAATARLMKPFRSPLIKSSSVSSAAARSEPQPANHKVTSLQSSETNHATEPNTESTASIQDHETAVDDLYKQYTDLSRQLTRMRQSLDTAEQALNILKTNQQQSISNLTEHWTSVIRDTAEELFEDTKARVEREGGMLKSRERSWPFDESEPTITEEAKEICRVQQEEDRAQALKYGLIKSIEEPDDSSENTSFTMATMLRQMDVDLDLVGYNEAEQRFVT